MSLESEFKQLQDAHRRYLVAYTLLTDKKIKSKATEARKALGDMVKIIKDHKKSILEFKKNIKK